MPNIYIARSASLQEWSADVGLTEHVYKVGVADGGAEAAVTALNAESFAGATDWKLLKEEAVEAVDMTGVAEKLVRKEKAVDPTMYPRLKGAMHLFKVKMSNVQTRLLVNQMMAGQEEKLTKKPKAADVAEYLIRTALD
jgi:hypothetical protein